MDTVREVVDGAVGPFAENDHYETEVDGLYCEMEVDGLTPQLS